MNYRPEIDGLRAVALIPVILFHAGFGAFSGGFVGVDVFFVISGYLITTIIYRDVTAGRFDIARFYERRARRMLPALFVVIAATLIPAWLWFLPNEFEDFSQSLVGVASFTSNILFWMESGYFEGPAELKPLLHTWSLAVEEQFYIAWPLLLLLIHRWCAMRLTLLLALGVTGSLLLAQWASATHASANFYLLPTRAWELGVGALLALVVPRLIDEGDAAETTPTVIVPGRVRSRWMHRRFMRELAGALGLGLIIAAVVTFDDSTPFPSLWALIPVLGAGLVIAGADPTTWTGRFLATPALVGIGLVSYSAYLWHQPLFAFARIRLLNGVPTGLYLILICASLLLAWVTWWAIEVPARRSTRLTRRQVLSYAALGSVLIASLGAAGWRSEGVTAANRAVANDLRKWKNSTSPFRDSCHNRNVTTQTCLLGSEVGPAVYVWGDSHGVELAWQLSSLQPRLGVRQITRDGCRPARTVAALAGGECQRFSEETLRWLTEAATPGIVVWVARWQSWLESTRFDNSEGGVEFGRAPRSTPEGWESWPAEQRISLATQDLSETAEALRRAGHHLAILYPVPEVGWDVPERLARASMRAPELGLLTTAHAVYRHRTASARAVLDALPAGPSVARVHPEHLFCDVGREGRCRAQLPDGTPLYFDDDHPNEFGARLLAGAMLEAFARKGWLPPADVDRAHSSGEALN